MNKDQAAFKHWHDEWAKSNQRENGWFPQPSIFEAFIAGFEAAQKIMAAPNEQNSETD